MNHKHWEFDSICPHCGNVTHIISPKGELVISVRCEHCSHGYEYTHIVHEHIEVDDSNT